MGSSFAGLSTALSGLYTARRGLEMAGQNVANANTEGYTRQRLSLESIGAPATPAMYSTYDGTGGGVGVNAVERLRDSFMESRGHTEHGRSSFLQTKSAALAQVEDILAEPGDSGLQSQLSDFWSAWHDLSNSPGDGAARSQLLQRAGTLVDSMHQTDASFDTQWRGAHVQLKALVSEVNTAAGALAELNVAITRDTQAGIPANELADQRDKLIMKLADQIGATVKPGKDGTVDVYVGGTALVRGATVQKLQVTGADSLEKVMDVPPPKAVVSWVADGYPAAVELGEAAGHLETLNTILPTYAGKLDGFAADLAGAVNAVHTGGYGNDGVTGRDFFAGTTAKTITLAITSKDADRRLGVRRTARSTAPRPTASPRSPRLSAGRTPTTASWSPTSAWTRRRPTAARTSRRRSPHRSTPPASLRPAWTSTRRWPTCWPSSTPTTARPACSPPSTRRSTP